MRSSGKQHERKPANKSKQNADLIHIKLKDELEKQNTPIYCKEFRLGLAQGRDSVKSQAQTVVPANKTGLDRHDSLSDITPKSVAETHCISFDNAQKQTAINFNQKIEAPTDLSGQGFLQFTYGVPHKKQRPKTITASTDTLVERDVLQRIVQNQQIHPFKGPLEMESIGVVGIPSLWLSIQDLVKQGYFNAQQLGLLEKYHKMFAVLRCHRRWENTRIFGRNANALAGQAPPEYQFFKNKRLVSKFLEQDVALRQSEIQNKQIPLTRQYLQSFFPLGSVGSSQSNYADSENATYKMVNSDKPLIKQVLETNFVQQAVPDSNNWSLLWSCNALVGKQQIYDHLHEGQKINHFLNSTELTRKDRLYANFKRFKNKFGHKQFNFLPETYILPEQTQEFTENFASYETKLQYGSVQSKHSDEQQFRYVDNIWIVKPAKSSQGRGIYLLKDLKDLPKEEGDFVVSKYISKPLLISGHKFDLRVYVLVTSVDPLKLYVYNEGLVRFASQPYNNDFVQAGKFSHLTNYSINKKSVSFVQNKTAQEQDVGNKWSMSALQQHLQKLGIDFKQVWHRIYDMIIKSLITVEAQMTCNNKKGSTRSSNCFELFGFDILLDTDLNPWILEVNLAPSLTADSPLDFHIKSNLVVDLFNLAGIRRPAKRTGKPITRVPNKSNSIANNAENQATQKTAGKDMQELSSDETNSQTNNFSPPKHVEQTIQRLVASKQTPHRGIDLGFNAARRLGIPGQANVSTKFEGVELAQLSKISKVSAMDRNLLYETLWEFERNTRLNFTRIYPSVGSNFYDQFFERERPNNKHVYKYLCERTELWSIIEQSDFNDLDNYRSCQQEVNEDTSPQPNTLQPTVQMTPNKQQEQGLFAESKSIELAKSEEYFDDQQLLQAEAGSIQRKLTLQTSDIFMRSNKSRSEGRIRPSLAEDDNSAHGKSLEDDAISQQSVLNIDQPKANPAQLYGQSIGLPPQQRSSFQVKLPQPTSITIQTAEEVQKQPVKEVRPTPCEGIQSAKVNEASRQTMIAQSTQSPKAQNEGKDTFVRTQTNFKLQQNFATQLNLSKTSNEPKTALLPKKMRSPINVSPKIGLIDKAGMIKSAEKLEANNFVKEPKKFKLTNNSKPTSAEQQKEARRREKVVITGDDILIEYVRRLKNVLKLYPLSTQPPNVHYYLEKFVFHKVWSLNDQTASLLKIKEFKSGDLRTKLKIRYVEMKTRREQVAVLDKTIEQRALQNKETTAAYVDRLNKLRNEIVSALSSTQVEQMVIQSNQQNPIDIVNFLVGKQPANGGLLTRIERYGLKLVAQPIQVQTQMQSHQQPSYLQAVSKQQSKTTNIQTLSPLNQIQTSPCEKATNNGGQKENSVNFETKMMQSPEANQQNLKANSLTDQPQKRRQINNVNQLVQFDRHPYTSNDRSCGYQTTSCTVSRMQLIDATCKSDQEEPRNRFNQHSLPNSQAHTENQSRGSSLSKQRAQLIRYRLSQNANTKTSSKIVELRIGTESDSSLHRRNQECTATSRVFQQTTCQRGSKLGTDNEIFSEQFSLSNQNSRTNKKHGTGFKRTTTSSIGRVGQKFKPVGNEMVAQSYNDQNKQGQHIRPMVSQQCGTPLMFPKIIVLAPDTLPKVNAHIESVRKVKPN